MNTSWIKVFWCINMQVNRLWAFSLQYKRERKKREEKRREKKERDIFLAYKTSHWREIFILFSRFFLLNKVANVTIRYQILILKKVVNGLRWRFVSNLYIHLLIRSWTHTTPYICLHARRRRRRNKKKCCTNLHWIFIDKKVDTKMSQL